MKILIQIHEATLEQLEKALEQSQFSITKVLSTDKDVVEWAKSKGLSTKLGNDAVKALTLFADGLIAIWDGKERVVKEMIDLALSQKLPTYVHYFTKEYTVGLNAQ